MTGVLVVAHHEREEGVVLARQAADWLAARGHECWMTPEDAKAVELDDLVSERPPEEAGLALSLGGDGTTLRAVDLVSAAGVPVLGVNVGLLGYLNEVEPSGLLDALEGFFADQHTIEERMMLSVQIRRHDGRLEPPVQALNEAVVERDESGHTVRLAVHIDGEAFISYAADGLIVATPTGSTAYSLSAGGPILHPGLAGWVLVPIASHTLSNRPIVLPDSGDVRITVVAGRDASANFDMQALASLMHGDQIRVRRSPHKVRFLHPRGWSYYATLRRKLRWYEGVV